MLYLGRWKWRDGPMPHWGPPDNCVGSIDLRSLPQCAQTVTPAGFGLFDVEGAAPAGYQVFGADMEDSPPDAIKDKISTALGLAKVPAWLRCGDIVREILTLRCDPTGQSRVKGLMPSVNRRMQLRIGKWHASRPFKPGEVEEWPMVRQALHQQYREARLSSLSGAAAPQHYLKVLDYWCDKFGTKNWQQFVPDDLPKLEPVKHSTTITDNFDRTDAGTLGTSAGGWSWATVIGTMEIVSNKAKATGIGAGGLYGARAETNLSSDDHYAESTIEVQNSSCNGGAAVRFDPSANTHYGVLVSGSSRIYLVKRIAGTDTFVANEAITPSIPELYRITVDGSGLSGDQAGAERVTGTDTAITGNLRVGFSGYHEGSAIPIFDDFQAADLAAASGGVFPPLMGKIVRAAPAW